jgi:hypothetical protein
VTSSTAARAALAAGLAAAAGCGPGYVPRHPDPIAMTGSVYIKDEKTYSRDLLLSNLPELVADDAIALSYAEAAKTYQMSALGLDLLSAVTSVAGVVVALRSPDKLNDTWAQILINTGVATSVLGPVLHVRAGDRELDAVNAYNDRLRDGPPGRLPARRDSRRAAKSRVTTCGLTCWQF